MQFFGRGDAMPKKKSKQRCLDVNKQATTTLKTDQKLQIFRRLFTSFKVSNCTFSIGSQYDGPKERDCVEEF